jgi:hypothetical protein
MVVYVKEVTMPKLTWPAPRRAKKRSGWDFAVTVRRMVVSGRTME